ncbi:hypothetical protein [Streptomyces sp. NPDC058373]|uniref:hypothetical protein n=1 Tax=unclassified Streptomyces TaxID=2593676 RepID=UPI00365B15FF
MTSTTISPAALDAARAYQAVADLYRKAAAAQAAGDTAAAARLAGHARTATRHAEAVAARARR